MTSRQMRIVAGLTMAVVVAGGAAWAIKVELDGGHAISLYREWRRDRFDAELARSLESVPCPASAFVLAALGQSNAGNHLGPRVSGDPTLPAFAFFRDRCVRLSDPVPGATGDDGSIWTSLAHQMVRQHGQPVVVIAGAAAGSSVRDWDRDHAGMTSRVQRSLAAAAQRGLSPRVIVWLQGESDGEKRTSQHDYATNLERVIGRINAGLAAASTPSPVPSPTAWIITQTSRCWGEATRSEEVRAGQRAVAQRIVGGHVGPDTDSLDDSYRRDGCHFGERGRERIASELATAIAKVVR